MAGGKDNPLLARLFKAVWQPHGQFRDAGIGSRVSDPGSV